jgi:DNA-binding response OmpR family regulator
MRVLVVSSDPSERLRATSALHAGEVDVVEADGVDAARELVRTAQPAFDVLVVDGDLEPRGGYALLYELRSQAVLAGVAGIPSIVLASRTQDTWLTSWAGAGAMFLKPVDPFEVAAKVRELPDHELPPFGDAGSAAAQVGTALRRSGR